MRTGGYTFQQSLTHESAGIVRQAMSLARRRGHSHVTPLHVASAMLASSSGLFRRACLHSHSHPLQCKALELCFNVALNRLPTSSSNPILGPHSHLPSLSNALVAAFKRAQAHQRRGSIENQQQPILALKVEVEQLVISILDDPSVSRVMREAGFSSSQVKTNVEQAVSLEVCSSKEAGAKPLVLGNNNNVSQLRLPSFSKTSSYDRPSQAVIRDDDVMGVLEALMSKKRKNSVIVGECLATAEGVVRGVIEKINKGEVPGEDMRHVQFISVPLLTLRNVSRDEFEVKLGELRTLVKSYISRGVVLYLGDLKWVSEFWSKYADQSSHYYSPVEHMIMELSRLLCGGGIGENNGRLWLMGIATFQTYIKCKTGHPSLETLWSLHPLTIPVGTLALSLKLESDLNGQFGSKAAVQEGSSWALSRQHHNSSVEKHLTCCADCLANFNKDARNLASHTPVVKTEPTTTTTSLPSWLQKCKEEETTRQTTNDQECDKISDLCKKWNSICSSIHKQHTLFPEKTLSFSSPSPCSSASISSNDQRSSKLHQSLLSWPVIFESNQSPKEHQFFASENEAAVEGTNSMIPDTKPDLLSNPNSSPNSASSSEASGNHHHLSMECLNRFNEVNSENMNILCRALEKKVPWQKDSIIPEIVSTVLQCRSGMAKKGNNNRAREKKETWMSFLGVDSEGKERIARELARVVFGSEDNFVPIGISSLSSSATRADSAEEEVVSKKRARDEQGRSYLERFMDAVRENPSRVFFMEDLDQADYHSQKGIKKLIESGSFTPPHDGGGEVVGMKDAIVIFSCESSGSRAPSPPPSPPKHIQENKDQEKPCWDLNVASEDHSDERCSTPNNNAGILEAVDKQILFKIQVL
ncbi:PREDICTED: protein SMAX1-LIKE 3-like isoform X2 [Ipomoea nil]|uniref:protein SMAX1-LIKE 3-like isoform X2 n=1 Tax=Ipomoea nil TaxID=35883 RepID=UPI0009018D47|nr:PREDICTED: protein SMAX1-LIKE 3-like isoform X2 [Ipomoea nil]